MVKTKNIAGLPVGKLYFSTILLKHIAETTLKQVVPDHQSRDTPKNGITVWFSRIFYSYTYMHARIQTDRHTYRHTYRQTYRHTDRQTDIQTDRHTYLLFAQRPRGHFGHYLELPGYITAPFIFESCFSKHPVKNTVTPPSI